MNDIRDELLESAKWTVAAPGIRVARATPTFWNLWRADKESVRAAGCTPVKNGAGWTLQWLDDDAAPEESQPEASSMVWSDEQEAIFGWFANGQGNLIVQARAGTGKTTTIKHAFSHAPESSILYAVFNKKNQVEAEAKITDHRVDVKTLHALGYAYIRNVWGKAQPDNDGNVEWDRIRKVEINIPQDVASVVKRLVSFAKNLFVNPSLQDLVQLAEDRDCVIDDFGSAAWNVAKIASVALAVLEESKRPDPQGRISFDDMVWLPLACGWVRPWYQLVAVDEAQDMNVPQLMMAIKAVRPGGRVVVVGDDRQAIYGFRGAAQDGMGLMREVLNAQSLSLTVTYRCPQRVVGIAQEFVPDYRAHESNAVGIVDTLGEDAMLRDLEAGDAVLSRVNAPLMPLCLSLLRRGVPARIEGRDIGAALVAIVEKLKAASLPQFAKRVMCWGEKRKKRLAGLENVEAKYREIEDQVATLLAVAEGCSNVQEIVTRLRTLFVDSNGDRRPAVIFSSIHKAKGLEWEHVYLLRDTFRKRGGKEVAADSDLQGEEANLFYVAVTRSKMHLTYVRSH